MTTETNGAMYHVPATAAELKPPRQADAITEASNLLRSHWEELHPYWGAISGELPSIHGSRNFDEAGCTFRVQVLAERNGFHLISKLPAAKLWTTLRRAFMRNTGVSVKVLEKQHARLRLEHKLPVGVAAPPAAEAAE